MVLMATITLFSFTEDSEFSSSSVYKVIEVITIMTMFITAGAEFVVVAINIYWDMTKCCRKKLKKVNTAQKAKIGKLPETSDVLGREQGTRGWSISRDESSTLKLRRKVPIVNSNRSGNNSHKQGLAKERQSIDGRKRVIDESDPFRPESSQKDSKENQLRRPSRRLRPVGIPVKIRLKKTNESEGQQLEKKFIQRKVKVDAEDFVLSIEK